MVTPYLYSKAPYLSKIAVLRGGVTIPAQNRLFYKNSYACGKLWNWHTASGCHHVRGWWHPCCMPISSILKRVSPSPSKSG